MHIKPKNSKPCSAHQLKQLHMVARHVTRVVGRQAHLLGLSAPPALTQQQTRPSRQQWQTSSSHRSSHISRAQVAASASSSISSVCRWLALTAALLLGWFSRGLLLLLLQLLLLLLLLSLLLLLLLLLLLWLGCFSRSTALLLLLLGWLSRGLLLFRWFGKSLLLLLLLLLLGWLCRSLLLPF
jgi:hypothetical protein